MADRENLYELIVDAENEFYKNNHYAENSKRIESVVEYLIAHGVTVKQIQKPIKRGHLLENSPCWFEARYDNGYFDLEPAEITKGTGANYYIYLIGSETATKMDGKEYGESWRCWANRPTYEERRTAEWEQSKKEGIIKAGE